MKQKDIAIIIVIVFVAGFASFFLSGFLFGGESKQQQVEKVDAITTNFPLPDKKYYNEGAINPAQDIQVTDNQNDNPFGN